MLLKTAGDHSLGSEAIEGKGPATAHMGALNVADSVARVSETPCLSVGHGFRAWSFFLLCLPEL